MRRFGQLMCRVFTSGVWTVTLLGLVLPLNTAVAAQAAVYEVEFPSLGKTFEVVHSVDGYVVRDPVGSIAQSVTVAQDQVEVRLLRDDRNSMVAIASLIDALGTTQHYAVTAEQDLRDGSLQASIYAMDGTLLVEDMVVRPPIDQDPEAIIIIIPIAIGVGVAGVIVCGVIGGLTNCIEDCGAACEHGMISAEEGFCGTCRCVCASAPDEGSSDGDPVGECPAGTHECCDNQCCSDSEPPTSCD